MTICICDDNKHQREQLYSLISEYFIVNSLEQPPIHLFEDGYSLLNNNLSTDIVFLDIEMAGMNGLTVANKIIKKNAKAIIIIVTSYNDYLDDAMGLNVFRYLSKPIDKNRLFRNLKQALDKYGNNNRYLFIELSEKTYPIRVNDIVYIESDKRNSIIYTTDNKFCSSNSISYWQDFFSLNEAFYSPHRSFIINLGYVDNFSHNNISLLNGKYSVFLSRRKLIPFKEKFMRFLERSC